MDNNNNQLPKNAKLVFKGKIFDVYHWKQKMFDNSIETFEKLKRTDTAVVIAVVRDKIIIGKQKQPDKPNSFLSLPGGRCDKNEPPLLAAKRELLEETGYASDDWELLEKNCPSKKIIWTVHIFIARNCYKKADQKLDAGEKIKIKLVNLENFLLLSESKNFHGQEMRVFLYKLRLYPQEKEKFYQLLFKK